MEDLFSQQHDRIELLLKMCTVIRECEERLHALRVKKDLLRCDILLADKELLVKMMTTRRQKLHDSTVRVGTMSAAVGISAVELERECIETLTWLKDHDNVNF